MIRATMCPRAGGKDADETPPTPQEVAEYALEVCAGGEQVPTPNEWLTATGRGKSLQRRRCAAITPAQGGRIAQTCADMNTKKIHGNERTMPLIRVKKHAHNYVIVDKAGIEDVRLSFRARGLLLYLLTKPDDWEVDIKHLTTQAREGRDALYAAMGELERAGYARKIMVRKADGTLQGYQTWIYEHPDLSRTESGFPGIGDVTESGFPGIGDEQGNMRVPTESGKPGTGLPNPENQELVSPPTIKVSKDLKSKDLRQRQDKENIPAASAASSSGDDARVTTAAELCELFNRTVPPAIPKITRLSEARKTKIALYLRQFPEREFWLTCFEAPKWSALLRGERPSPGHEGFKLTLDWLLTKGKDGTENCVKVYEGRYADTPGARAASTLTEGFFKLLDEQGVTYERD